ncbi:hypothetical protein EsH8_IX_000580 [Colletotrichum jinshuiense]
MDVAFQLATDSPDAQVYEDLDLDHDNLKSHIRQLCEGHKNIVQTLLEMGADINAQSEDYGDALQAASTGGHETIVQILLDKGADVNAQGGLFSNALQAASRGGHEAIVQMLLNNGANISGLISEDEAFPLELQGT